MKHCKTWIGSERVSFSGDLQNSKSNLKRSLVRIWITNMCPNFFGAQEANSSFSQQCPTSNRAVGRGLVNGRRTGSPIVGESFGHISTFRCKGRPATPEWRVILLPSSTCHMIWLTTLNAKFPRVLARPCCSFWKSCALRRRGEPFAPRSKFPLTPKSMPDRE